MSKPNPDPRLTWWIWRDVQERLVQWTHALLQGKRFTVNLIPEGSASQDNLNHVIQANPQLFSTCSPERQFRFTQGLLAHEVGHALFSDAWPDQEDGALCTMTNLLEDERIERAVTVYYPGIAPLLRQTGNQMLTEALRKPDRGLSDTQQAFRCCLTWRWAHKVMKEDRMLEKMKVTPAAKGLWWKVKPLVEQAWNVEKTGEVISLARKILNLLDIHPEEHSCVRLGMSSDIPKERAESALPTPHAPADDQPGIGLPVVYHAPMNEDSFSSPRPYIDLENRAASLASKLSESLKTPTPEIREAPHEYLGRFHTRQDLRTPETPNLALCLADRSPRSLALYLLVDRSGSMCEVEEDVRLALMTVYLAATRLSIPIGVACFGAGDHPGSPDRVFELTPVSIEANESCKALIAGFTGTTGAEFLDWGLKLAEERLSVLSERRKIILIIHDGRPVYQGEEGNDWELSLQHLHHLEARGITPIGVYLGTSAEDLTQLKQLFPRLVHTSGNALPDRLGDLLRGLVG